MKPPGVGKNGLCFEEMGQGGQSGWEAESKGQHDHDIRAQRSHQGVGLYAKDIGVPLEAYAGECKGQSVFHRAGSRCCMENRPGGQGQSGVDS